MAQRTRGGIRPNRLYGLAAAMAMLGVALGPAAAASATAPVASLALQPASGTAATSITATFRVRLADRDDDCDLTTMFRWDGRLVNAHFTDGCTARYTFRPLPGASGAGAHQVTAEDVHTGARATAVFRIVAPAASQSAAADATGRTMVNGSAGGLDGGERATEPRPSPDTPAPLTYTGAGRVQTAGFPLSSWLIASGAAILVLGALVIVVIFPVRSATARGH
jgi:hypothetical protein